MGPVLSAAADTRACVPVIISQSTSKSTTKQSREQPKKEKNAIKVVTVGLNGVGKSAILHQLKYGTFPESIGYDPRRRRVPSISMEISKVTIEYKNVLLNLWDVDGGEKSGQLWTNYLQDVQAIIFVVDSTNRDEIEDARYELIYLICLQANLAQNSTILILANKQDLPGAMGAELIRDKLRLSAFTGRNWHVQPCSAVTRTGLYEGLEWLLSQIIEES